MKKSLIITIAVLLFLVILISGGIGRYNRLQVADEAITAQWAQVENVYQRRADLIPNLVNTVKGYADFEQETLTSVIEARAKATSTNINADNLNASSLQQFQQNQDALSSALSRLMVVVERYPELKANQGFLELQAQLEGTENRIATERRRFNEVAREFNATIRTFPNNIFASMSGLQQRAYFESESGAEKAPEVNFN